MRYQQDEAWCGPTAIQNALRCLGLKKSAREIAELCRTTDGGTDERDMLRGIRGMGYDGWEFQTDDRMSALQWIGSCNMQPHILCVDSWDHWVCLAGWCGQRVALLDSVQTPANRQENGIHMLKPETVLRRWRAGRKVARNSPRFYGISVG